MEGIQQGGGTSVSYLGLILLMLSSQVCNNLSVSLVCGFIHEHYDHFLPYAMCVNISGQNGTIDGQGAQWWQQFHKKKLKYTRPYLIEIMHSDNIQISNLTLVNSPSWNVHPVYSRYNTHKHTGLSSLPHVA